MIGNLRGGKTLIDGREYAIPKHGFARDNEFSAVKKSETEAVFSLIPTKKQKPAFRSILPFRSPIVSSPTVRKSGTA